MENEENPREVVRRREEIHFFELFYRIFTLMLPAGVNQEEIENEIEDNLIGRFRRRLPHGACNIRYFQTYVKRLAYFYWSSPLTAGVSRKKTLAALRGCEEFRSRFSELSLKVVSVGAGTGSDLVGLFSAIHEYFEESGEPENIFREMEVLLMDNFIRWEPFFRSVVKSLRNPDTDFGNAGQWMRNRNITTAFIHADLEELPDDEQEGLPDDEQRELRRELGNTHIVWMKALMSTQKTDEHRRSIVDNIVSVMTLGALLVVIDSPTYHDHVTSDGRLDRIFTTLDNKEITELELFPNHEGRPQYSMQSNQEISIYKKSSEE